MMILDWPTLFAGVVLGMIPSLILFSLSGREAAKLRRLTSMVLQAMERKGWVTPIYDSKDEIAGIEINIELQAAKLRLAPHPSTVTISPAGPHRDA